jgi:hypothetical protein
VRGPRRTLAPAHVHRAGRPGGPRVTRRCRGGLGGFILPAVYAFFSRKSSGRPARPSRSVDGRRAGSGGTGTAISAARLRVGYTAVCLRTLPRSRRDLSAAGCGPGRGTAVRSVARSARYTSAGPRHTRQPSRLSLTSTSRLPLALRARGAAPQRASRGQGMACPLSSVQRAHRHTCPVHTVRLAGCAYSALLADVSVEWPMCSVQ